MVKRFKYIATVSQINVRQLTGDNKYIYLILSPIEIRLTSVKFKLLKQVI